VSEHVAVVAVPLAAHGAPYTPSADPLRVGSIADRGRLCSVELEDVPAPHVIDERPHVTLVRVTHTAHGGPGLGMRHAYVLVVRRPVNGQSATQFARQRRQATRACDVVVLVVVVVVGSLIAAVAVMRAVVGAHGRSEKPSATAGHVTRQVRVGTVLVSGVPPQFRLAAGAMGVARFAHFAQVCAGRLSAGVGPGRHKVIGHRHGT